MKKQFGWPLLEQERLTLQSTLDNGKTGAERNRLGQYATPTQLARHIIQFAASLIPENQPIRFFDPAFGTGSFYSALRYFYPNGKISRAEGFEIDPHYGVPSAKLWEEAGLQLNLADFTDQEPRPEFNLLICNPPYVRHHHLNQTTKQRLYKKVFEISGAKLSGLAGLYCYFLNLSHGWMENNGIAAWLARQLSMRLFRPILPSPRFLSAEIVNGDSHGNPILDKQLFLLDPGISEKDIQENHPVLWKYLEEGKLKGIDKGYLCSHREPWYSQETRGPAPLLCTYMGRGDVQTRRPFRFILNNSKATATNVYLAMYPTPVLLELLKKKPSLIIKIWKFLNQIPSRELLAGGRVYGGGLHKLEPKELSNLPLSELKKWLDS